MRKDDVKEDTASELSLRTKNFHSKFKEIRKMFGWDMSRLHIETGIDQDKLNAFQRGTRPPNLLDILRLCESFGLTPNHLLCIEDEIKNHSELAMSFYKKWDYLSRLKPFEQELVDDLIWKLRTQQKDESKEPLKDLKKTLSALFPKKVE